MIEVHALGGLSLPKCDSTKPWLPRITPSVKYLIGKASVVATAVPHSGNAVVKP